MDQFEMFFSFYGLILGLGATEVLGGVGVLVRERSLKSLRWSSSLLAFLTFVIICATWIDAWDTRASFALNFGSLWAPIGAATSYYLAAVVVLPKRAETWDSIGTYFLERKTFVVACLIVAEVFIKVTLLPTFAEHLRVRPMLFWLYSVPLNLAVFAGFAAILLARTQRTAIGATAFQIAVFIMPYGVGALITRAISRAYGYPLA